MFVQRCQPLPAPMARSHHCCSPGAAAAPQPMSCAALRPATTARAVLCVRNDIAPLLLPTAAAAPAGTALRCAERTAAVLSLFEQRQTERVESKRVKRGGRSSGKRSHTNCGAEWRRRGLLEVGEDLRQQHGSGGQQQDEANKDRTPPPPSSAWLEAEVVGWDEPHCKGNATWSPGRRCLKWKQKIIGFKKRNPAHFCPIWMLLPFVGSPNTEPTVTINGAVSAGWQQEH